MPEMVNTTFLGDTLDGKLDAGKQTMISVDHVTMVFNIASERLNSLKEYAIALARRELHFKEFHALDDVSLEVRKGDVYGIIGTNGSGKSTLLKIVAGVLEPTRGKVTINGNIAPLIELGAGFDMDLTARENVYLNGALLGYPRKFIDEHFDEIVDFAEVRDFLDMPLKNYSSGMIARIAFAIATVIVPEILIVDEVLSVGDFMFQQKCERRILSLIKNHGVTVLIVSHSNDQIERLCTKAIWIEKGHTRMVGSAREVCQAYRALGGRTGSGAAEQSIVKATCVPLSDPREFYSALTGEDRFATAVKVAEEYHDTQDKAVVVPSSELPESLLGSSLCGLLDGVLLTTGGDHLPSSTLDFLNGMSPSLTVLLSLDGQVAGAPLTRLVEEAPGSLERIQAHDRCELSLAVFEYGRRLAVDGLVGGWGDTAIVASAAGNGGLITISSFAYRHRAPVFLIDGAEGCDAGQAAGPAVDRIIDTVASSFRRVVIVDEWDSGKLPDAVIEGLAASSLEVVRLSGADAFAVNKAVNSWIDVEDDRLGHTDTYVMSTAWEPVDAYTVGPYIANGDRLLHMEDPANLDHTAETIAMMEAGEGRVREVVFLGGEDRFSLDDRKILARAVASAKLDAGLIEFTEDEPDDEGGRTYRTMPGQRRMTSARKERLLTTYPHPGRRVCDEPRPSDPED